MRGSRFQFTTRQMMVAVLVAAALTLLRTNIGFGIVLMLLPGLALAAIGWRFIGHRPSWTGVMFLGTIFLINLLASLGCIYAYGIGEMIIGWALALWITPVALSFGVAWAREITRNGARRWHSPKIFWPLVLYLTALMPVGMYLQVPTQIAFHISKPALNRLADRISARQLLQQPERAGIYWIVGTDLDPTTGNVALITDPNSSGRSGFVRLSSDKVPISGPFTNLFYDNPLDDRWRFQVED